MHRCTYIKKKGSSSCQFDKIWTLLLCPVAYQGRGFCSFANWVEPLTRGLMPPDPHSLNWICWTPPKKKIPGITPPPEKNSWVCHWLCQLKYSYIKSKHSTQFVSEELSSKNKTETFGSVLKQWFQQKWSLHLKAVLIKAIFNKQLHHDRFPVMCSGGISILL
jgi:hypothetical protein